MSADQGTGQPDIRASNSVLGRGTLYTLGTVAPVAAGLIITPLLTRSLSPREYGVVATCLVAVQVVSMLAGLGLAAGITRHVLMEDTAARGGRTLVLQAAAVSVTVSVLIGSSSMVWSPWAFPYPWRPAILAAVIAGGATSIIGVAQALLRGEDKVTTFVLASICTTLIGQGFGLTIALIWQTAEGYVFGLAAGYALIAGSLLLSVAWRKPRISGGFTRALEISLPTVPHQIALYLSTGILVLIAAQRMGLEDAGRLQIAMVVGSAPALVVNSMNNSWAPEIYATSLQDRAQVLQRTACDIAWLTAGVSTATALVAPFVLWVVAPPSLRRGDELSSAVAITSCVGVLSVFYLSNVHLVFAEGRTRALAAVTPITLGLTAILAQVISLLDNLVALAACLPIFYLIQGSMVSGVRRRISPTRWRQAVLLAPISSGVLGCLVAFLTPASGAWLALRLIGSVGISGWVLSRLLRALRAPRNELTLLT